MYPMHQTNYHQVEFIRVPEHQAKEANEQSALNVDRFRRSSDVVTNEIDV